MGRRRAGGRRPGRRGRAGPVRRRPGARRWPARRPSGAPTCWSCTTRCSCTAVHGVAATTPKGRTLAHADRARLRAADRAHQRRPGGRRRLGGAGARARAAPTSGRSRRGPTARQARRVTSRRPTPTRSATALAEAGAGPDRRLRQSRRSRSPGEGRFRPLEGAHPRSARSASSRWSTRCGSRRCCRAPRAAQVVAAMLAAHPYEEPAYDVVELADPGTAATGAGPDRRRRRDHARASFARHVAGGAAGDRPRRAGRRRPGPRRTPGGRVRGSRATSCSTSALRSDADVYVTSDLRHHPATEFLEQGGPALVDVAHWAAEWTWLPVVAGAAAPAPGRYGGDPGQHDLHRPVDVPPMTPTTQEQPLKADPSAQLSCSTSQELDARADQLRHQRAHAARARPSSPRSSAERTELDDQARDARIVVDDLDRRAGQGRRRRRAGQDPPRARPAADRPGPDHQPQGPRADAAASWSRCERRITCSRTTSSR